MTDRPTTRTIAVDQPEHELRRQALEQIRRLRSFRTHVVAYVLGNLFLAVVWATTEYHNAGGWPTGFRTGRMNHDWDPWIMYPVIAGTMALAVHAWMTFGRRPATEAEIAREINRLRSSAG
jgi:2TM domain